MKKKKCPPSVEVKIHCVKNNGRAGWYPQARGSGLDFALHFILELLIYPNHISSLLLTAVTYVNQGSHQVVNKSSRVMLTDQHIVLTNGDGEAAGYIVPGHQRDYEYVIDSNQRWEIK